MVAASPVRLTVVPKTQETNVLYTNVVSHDAIGVEDQDWMRRVYGVGGDRVENEERRPFETTT